MNKAAMKAPAEPEDYCVATLWRHCNRCGYVFKLIGTVIDGADVVAHKDECPVKWDYHNDRPEKPS